MPDPNIPRIPGAPLGAKGQKSLSTNRRVRAQNMGSVNLFARGYRRIRTFFRCIRQAFHLLFCGVIGKRPRQFGDLVLGGEPGQYFGHLVLREGLGANGQVVLGVWNANTQIAYSVNLTEISIPEFPPCPPAHANNGYYPEIGA